MDTTNLRSQTKRAVNERQTKRAVTLPPELVSIQDRCLVGAFSRQSETPDRGESLAEECQPILVGKNRVVSATLTVKLESHWVLPAQHRCMGQH